MTLAVAHQLVSDCMTPFVISVDRYASVAEAYDLMKANSIRRLPVVEKDNLVGLVTMRDVVEARPSNLPHSFSTWELNKQLSALIVDVVMTPNPITVFQSSTLGYAAELMVENKIGGLPVVAPDRKLLGLITESDIFRLIAKQWREDNARFSGVKPAKLDQ